MKFGLTKEEFEFIHQTIFLPIQKQGGKLYVYGSRARGDHKKFSDLDLMIEAAQKIAVSAIEETLQKSNFPYKVDLVFYDEFAESYKPGYEKDKVLWGL